MSHHSVTRFALAEHWGFRSRKRRNSSGASAQSADRSADHRSIETVVKPLYSHKPDQLPTEEDHRTKFYDTYHREADEYDREFIKRHDEDLNTTLIFVCI